MWLVITLIIVSCVVVGLVTAEVVIWLVKRSLRTFFHKELADLVKKAEEEKKREEER